MANRPSVPCDCPQLLAWREFPRWNLGRGTQAWRSPNLKRGSQEYREIMVARVQRTEYCRVGVQREDPRGLQRVLLQYPAELSSDQHMPVRIRKLPEARGKTTQKG